MDSALNVGKTIAKHTKAAVCERIDISSRNNAADFTSELAKSL